MRIVLMGLFACLFLSHTSIAQTRNLEAFEKLNVSGGIEVTLIKSNQHKAEVEMVRGDYDDLVTELKGDVLVIKFKSKNLSWGTNNNKAKIDLHYSTLRGFDISAGSTVKGNDAISANSMDIDVSSGATCSIEVETGELTVDVSSGATCSLRGSADEQEVDVSSGASYNGDKLASKNADVDASSGASAKVWVTDRLVADASSGASIRYKGNPKKTDIDSGKWSGGSVKKMGGPE